VRETLARTDQAAVNKLEKAWKAGRLPSVRTPYWRFDQDGKTWLGRGYVQLTHRKNYARAGLELGIDLLGNPSLAMKPDIAARILVRGSEKGWFTGKRLSDYLPGDYVNARRIINGTDKAHEIAALARTFEEALRASPAPSAAQKPSGLLEALLGALARIFGTRA
jgi:predicted chitinase